MSAAEHPEPSASRHPDATAPGAPTAGGHPDGESRDPRPIAQTPPPGEGVVHLDSNSEPRSTHRVSVVGVRATVLASGSRDQRVATVTDAQRGAVSREQLLAAGLSRAAIGRMLSRGSLRRLHPSVYAAGQIAQTPLARETAALLAIGHRAVLSHATAAQIWELPVPTPRTVHVLVAESQPAGRDGITVHRTRTLTPKDVRHRHGLPVTSPARTLLDLADTLTARPLERALDEALARRVVRRPQLHEVLSRANGRRGAGALEVLLERGSTTRTVSGPEERFLALVRQARLPEPETNARFLDFDVDVLWRAQRLAVEIDSYDYHSSPQKFQRDRAKGTAIVRAGYALLRPTPEQIEDDGLALIATIAETLARVA